MDTTGGESVADPAIVRDSPASGGRFGWLAITVAIFFGLFYVYDLFGAISNVVGVTSQITLYNDARAVVKLAPVPIPWFWLVVDLVAAPIAYSLAFVIGRRSTVPVKVLLFFVGLSLVAAVSLTAEALA
jgi:hypothetical protein